MLLGAITVISAAAAALICGVTGTYSDLSWLLWLPVSFVGIFLSCAGIVFVTVWISCGCVDLNKPQEKESKYFRLLVKLIPKAVFPVLLTKVHTKGMEQIPKKGRFMLVCNHINDLDPVTLLAYFPNSQLSFITKRENMSMFLVGKVMHKIRCHPINRENDREALKTIINCIKMLQEDEASIAVFPEGYTSVDGKLHHFRHGVFKIAQKANVPIVVCTLQNTNKVLKNAKKLKPTDVHLHLLKVIQPEEFQNMTTVQIGETVYQLMAEDLGPELVLNTEENA